MADDFGLGQTPGESEYSWGSGMRPNAEQRAKTAEWRLDGDKLSPLQEMLSIRSTNSADPESNADDAGIAKFEQS